MKKAKKKTAPRKASTALAVVPKKPAVVKITGMPSAEMTPIGQLGELATVGALGLAELKLTAAEEKILAEPVDPRMVAFKPKKHDGPPEIPYLPHIVYTRWFSRAFGRTGWALVPTSKPLKVEKLIMVTYVLFVHGIPVAQATGEHEYYESNKQQTYGDVIESTNASALRRCAKRLGVGLELWDKDWLHAHGFDRPQKVGGRSVASDVGYVDAEPVRPVSGPFDDEPIHSNPTITRQQQDRMIKIAEKAGRQPAEVRMWLKARWGVKQSADLLQKDYAEACRQLEARGPLPMPGDGQ